MKSRAASSWHSRQVSVTSRPSSNGPEISSCCSLALSDTLGAAFTAWAAVLVAKTTINQNHRFMDPTATRVGGRCARSIDIDHRWRGQHPVASTTRSYAINITSGVNDAQAASAPVKQLVTHSLHLTPSVPNPAQVPSVSLIQRKFQPSHS